MKKEKILKIRIGLNPNSSSIYGVIAMLFGLTGIAAVINSISSLIIARILHKKYKKEKGGNEEKNQKRS